jgi:hypothetical protein
MTSKSNIAARKRINRVCRLNMAKVNPWKSKRLRRDAKLLAMGR